MYKSKLQELCQRRGWNLPEYSTVKDGPGHLPRFTASINVNGEVFETPEFCRSSKEAQNTAARIAYENFNGPAPARPVNNTNSPVPVAARLSTVANFASIDAVPPVLPVSPLPSSLPFPPAGLLAKKNDANSILAKKEVPHLSYEDTTQDSVVHRTSIGSPDKHKKDTLQMYKNRLQQYAQKKSLGFPVYTNVVEGPPHLRRFKSKVSLDGKSFETSEFFTTLKEAEQAAAKVACQALLDGMNQEDGLLYKNLLQEFAQKKGLLCPSYETISSGMSHKPVFVSTVEIGSNSFRGTEANTKKQAEMIAAKIAYHALTKSCSVLESSKVSMNEGNLADNLTQNVQPTATIMQQDATHEGDFESQTNAKRAKFSPADMIENAHPPNPSNGDSTFDNSSSLSTGLAGPVSVEDQASSHKKTVVSPRNMGFPIPQCASVMPYSDDQWVAYKVGIDQEPTA
ncbi:hypothetical protein ACJIZ3_021676 [Penstemon smallii]|uniref:DRBM domain-containing protein n=1 Tax=Penstemon smallii TaxID=265156 RepID=A0ABD3SM45_9LAMI